MKYTLSFSEKVKGWTSFHDFIPDIMLRVNNDFYTIKQGELYKHNVEGIGFNNFYGTQYKSKVTTILNDDSDRDKIFKTLVLESTGAWKASVKTNYTESHIKSNEFNKKESRWFAYMRKNELESDLNKSTQGLGGVVNVDGLDIEFTGIPGGVSVGDELYQVKNDDIELIGTIQGVDGVVISIESFDNTPEAGVFCYSKKDSRIEGGEMRGYYLELELEDETSEQNELFGLSSEVVLSYL